MHCTAAHYHEGASDQGKGVLEVRGHVQVPILASVVDAQHNSGSGSEDQACSELKPPTFVSTVSATSSTNSATVAPIVALVRRGGCDFATKARRVLEAGFSALVVVDRQSESPAADQPPMPPALFTDAGRSINFSEHSRSLF